MLDHYRRMKKLSVRTPRFDLGFTLLEMLIVLSIIGVLIGLISVSFSTAQKKSRNARRRSDIKSVQNAFEQYYSIAGTYAGSCSTMTSVGTTVILPTGLPHDPKFTGGAAGDYTFNTGGTACSNNPATYCICAILEDEAGNATAPTGASCNYATTGGTYYCLGNLQ